MNPVALKHVAVCIDAAAAWGGVFREALDWASRLKLPLKIVGLPSGMASAPLQGAYAFNLDECLTAGAECGVPCEVIECGHWSAVREQLFGSHGLSAFGATLSVRVKTSFLRWSLRARNSAVLVCSVAGRPVSRMLIVHAPQQSDRGFLASALSLCRLFEVIPVILTVARTERQARQVQRAAEEACYEHRLAAHLDYVAGVDARVAVASIARWRRCSHVFLERRQAIPWWRWLRGDTLHELLGASDSLTFLALPEAGLQVPVNDATREHLATH